MTNGKIKKIGLWIIIALLSIICLYLVFNNNKNNDDNFISDVSFIKNETQYVDISKDKSLSELKKLNEELYDSIRYLSNVKEAMQIKYVTKYKTDTIHINHTYVEKDSIYHYFNENDTIKYKIDISGKDVKWFQFGFEMQDSLMIVTRSKNEQNETTITHSKNTDITNTTIFVPKRTFKSKIKEKTYFGIGVGAGYGVINKKPDIYIGINVGVKF